MSKEMLFVKVGMMVVMDVTCAMMMVKWVEVAAFGWRDQRKGGNGAVMFGEVTW